MCKVFSFLNNKGGVGKTTSAVNVSKAMSDLGYKVLLIDADAQGNSSKMCGFRRTEESGAQTLYDVMSGRASATDCIYLEGEKEGSFNFIPSSRLLSRCEQELVSATAREFILKMQIEPLKGYYDFIFIDCPPNDGLIVSNAMCASDRLIVPVNCEVFAIDGMSSISAKTEEMRKIVNPNLEILGYVMTRYDRRLSLHNEVVRQMEEMFPGMVFEAKIRTNIALAESPSFFMNIFDYDPASNGAADYKALTEEIVKRLNH